MNEENIFELLNEINENKFINKENSEIFLDSNGIPTDRFSKFL